MNWLHIGANQHVLTIFAKAIFDIVSAVPDICGATNFSWIRFVLVEQQWGNSPPNHQVYHTVFATVPEQI